MRVVNVLKKKNCSERRALLVVQAFPPLLKNAGGVAKRYLTLCSPLQCRDRREPTWERKTLQTYYSDAKYTLTISADAPEHR